MERCIEHFSHSPHSLILREIHHFKEGDHCHGCEERLLCKSFVYTCPGIVVNSCASFFLHKKCAHLPSSISTHHEYSNHQQHDLFLVTKPKTKPETLVYCKVCFIDIRYFYYYIPTTDFQVCLKCAKDLQDNSSKGVETIQHWSHQHTLLCVDRYATFHCDGCNKVSTDCSYKCDKCSFWIHQSCADLPKLYTCNHHKHPLTIASSLPEVYCNFFQKCKICKVVLNPHQWLYYCADCRFFAHIPCVVSTTPKLRGGLDDPKLMHLPAADEASMNFMMQKRIKDIISVSVDSTAVNATMANGSRLMFLDMQNPLFLHPKLMHLPAADEASMNFMMQKRTKDIITASVDSTVAAPPDHINHWAHQGHQLDRKNKSDVITATSDHHENSQQVSSAESLMICNGCTKPISYSSDDADVFYECNQCRYILHRYCAQFPIEIQHPVFGNYKGRPTGIFPYDIFACDGCSVYGNGFEMVFPISARSMLKCYSVDIWCACLPQEIKHRAHHHSLKQFIIPRLHQCCAACDDYLHSAADWPVAYRCESCDFYLHVKCVVKPGTLVHRWDPHPLSLVLSLEDDDIENHPHEFECEFCCQEINTNTWFYHCKVCDLSFHLHNCMDFDNHYSNVKFGATNIRIEEAHQHDMTLVLNKNEKALCGGCGEDTKGRPILECKPCNFIRHALESCCRM